MQTRSVGLGGLLAVLVTLAGSLTLVPAILRLVRPAALEWPAFLSRHTTASDPADSGGAGRRSWRRTPSWRSSPASALLLAMAAPALHTRIGFPESEFLPPELEFSRGMEMLDGWS